MIKPIDCVMVERSSIDKNTGNCIGTIRSSNSLKLRLDKTIYYKLLDKYYYSIINNMITYDFLRLNCIFGVDE